MLYNYWDEQPLMEEMSTMSCKWKTNLLTLKLFVKIFDNMYQAK